MADSKSVEGSRLHKSHAAPKYTSTTSRIHCQTYTHIHCRVTRPTPRVRKCYRREKRSGTLALRAAGSSNRVRI